MFRPRHRPPAHQSTAPAAIPSQHAACCKLAQVLPATPVQTAHPVLFSQTRPAASVMFAGPRPRGRRPKSINAQPCRPHSRAHAVEYMIAHGRRQARRRRHFRIGRAANRRRCARLAHPMCAQHGKHPTDELARIVCGSSCRSGRAGASSASSSVDDPGRGARPGTRAPARQGGNGRRRRKRAMHATRRRRRRAVTLPRTLLHSDPKLLLRMVDAHAEPVKKAAQSQQKRAANARIPRPSRVGNIHLRYPDVEP